MDWGVIINLASIAGAGFGTYVAIRSDLTRMHERLAITIERVESIEQRHIRIDDAMRSDASGMHQHKRAVR